MNAVAIDTIPRGKPDTYGDLLREGETPEQALRRLEKRRDYAKVIGSDDGQRLLAAATRQVQAVPNGGIRGRARPTTRIQAEAHEAAAAQPGLACVGSVHVPGHSPACPKYVAPPAPARVPAQLVEIPLELIDIGENVRVDPGELEGLAASLASEGLQQPILAVGPGANGRYRAVNGQRRILASRQAKLPTITAVVEAAADVDAPGAKRSIAQLAENLIRKDMNPVEEAAALRAVLDADKTLTQAELGRRLGRSEPWMASTLALLRAPKQVQDYVRTDKLTIAHAKALSGLPADDQVRLAKSAVSNSVSAHSLEQTAKWERSHQNERAAGERKTADAAKRGLAALEKAGIAKDVRLLVLAENWQIQDAEVRKVIKAAGYAVDAEGWARGGVGTARWSSCDCTALQLRIRDGEGSTVEPACVNSAHADARNREQSAVQAEKNRQAEAERKELRAAVAAAMPSDLNPTVGRLMLQALEGMYGKPWTEYSKLSDAEVVKRIAEQLTSDSTLHRGTYNGGQTSVPVKTLLKALGADGSGSAPELPSGRKPGKAKAAAS